MHSFFFQSVCTHYSFTRHRQNTDCSKTDLMFILFITLATLSNFKVWANRFLHHEIENLSCLERKQITTDL